MSKSAPTTAKTFVALALGAICLSTAAHARNDLLLLPLGDALRTPDAYYRLNHGIRLYFGPQPFGAPVQHMGIYTANRKTNFHNKTDKEGCEWAFLSSALSLQSRAMQLGGNAVVNLVSVYKNIPFSSDSQYQCSAGTVVGGVTLQGEVVTLR